VAVGPEPSVVPVAQQGRPGLPMRLLAGLHYLKHLYDVYDEQVVAGFLENPYWQYFCGEEFFRHDLPCDPTTLVKWRQRVGPARMEQLLQETSAAATSATAAGARTATRECRHDGARESDRSSHRRVGCITKRVRLERNIGDPAMPQGSKKILTT
jgi:Transposase domain (DUF772)